MLVRSQCCLLVIAEASGLAVVVLLAMVQMALNKLDQIQASLNSGRESIVRIERDIAHLSLRVTEIEERHTNIDQRPRR